MAGGGHGMGAATGAAIGWFIPESEDGGRGTLCERRLGMSGIVVLGSSGSASRFRSNFGAWNRKAFEYDFLTRG